MLLRALLIGLLIVVAYLVAVILGAEIPWTCVLHPWNCKR
jgi:hypothetical protein